MAHSLSAKKRIRQNAKRQARNRGRKATLKAAVRKVADAVVAGKKDQATAELKVTARTIDKIAATGTVHRNKAARLKSRLAKRVNKLA